MNAAASLLLLVMTASACTDTPHALLPTGATPVLPPAVEVGPLPNPDARLLERQAWQLRMTVREVDGGAACDLNAGATREVALGIDVYENEALVMYYDRAASPQPQAHWTGWRHGQAYEGIGVSFEAMSCRGAARAAGSPTTLTGYFSADGATFSAAEARRLPLPNGGEAVYYVDWLATRVS